MLTNLLLLRCITETKYGLVLTWKSMSCDTTALGYIALHC